MAHRFLLLLVAPLVMADAPPPLLRTWFVEKAVTQPQTVDVDLVRAKVRLVRTVRGPLQIKITAPRGAGTTGVEVHIEKGTRRIRVHDTYPQLAPTAAYHECVPRSTARGAFWRSVVVFDVLILAPPGVATRINIIESSE
jgi:hypothetical protein